MKRGVRRLLRSMPRSINGKISVTSYWKNMVRPSESSFLWRNIAVRTEASPRKFSWEIYIEWVGASNKTCRRP